MNNKICRNNFSTFTSMVDSPTRPPPYQASADYLAYDSTDFCDIDCVESRLDAMNQGVDDVPTVLDPPAPSISPTGGLRRRTRRHVVKPPRSKRSITKPENFHEESATDPVTDYPRRHRRTLARGDSLVSELGESETDPVTDYPRRHRRTLARGDSLVDEVGESLKKNAA
jgi:hypothetical protein